MLQGHQPRRQQHEQQQHEQQQQQPQQPRLELHSLAAPSAVPPPPPPPLPPPPHVHTVESLQLTPAPSPMHNNGAMCGKPTTGMVKVSMSPEGRLEERGRYGAAAAAPPPEAIYRGGAPEPPCYLIPPPGEQPAAVLDKSRQWGPQVKNAWSIVVCLMVCLRN